MQLLLKKHTQFKTRVQKRNPSYMYMYDQDGQNWYPINFMTWMVKINTQFMSEIAEKPYPFGLHIST